MISIDNNYEISINEYSRNKLLYDQLQKKIIDLKTSHTILISNKSIINNNKTKLDNMYAIKLDDFIKFQKKYQERVEQFENDKIDTEKKISDINEEIIHINNLIEILEK